MLFFFLSGGDDLQIINEIPGKNVRNIMGGPTSLSSSLFSPGNLFNSPSLLSAQDPFYALTQSMGAASGSTSNSTMDLLQKCKLKNILFHELFKFYMHILLSHFHFLH